MTTRKFGDRGASLPGGYEELAQSLVRGSSRYFGTGETPWTVFRRVQPQFGHFGTLAIFSGASADTLILGYLGNKLRLSLFGSVN